MQVSDMPPFLALLCYILHGSWVGRFRKKKTSLVHPAPIFVMYNVLHNRSGLQKDTGTTDPKEGSAEKSKLVLFGKIA